MTWAFLHSGGNKTTSFAGPAVTAQLEQRLDATTLWQFVDDGGVLGVLVVLVGYLAIQNRKLSDRNDVLVDRFQALSESHATLAAEIKAGLDKIVDRLNARN